MCGFWANASPLGCWWCSQEDGVLFPHPPIWDCVCTQGGVECWSFSFPLAPYCRSSISGKHWKCLGSQAQPASIYSVEALPKVHQVKNTRILTPSPQIMPHRAEVPCQERRTKMFRGYHSLFSVPVHRAEVLLYCSYIRSCSGVQNFFQEWERPQKLSATQFYPGELTLCEEKSRELHV